MKYFIIFNSIGRINAVESIPVPEKWLKNEQETQQNEQEIAEKFDQQKQVRTVDSDRESGERTPTEKEPLTGYAHIYAAISAIVNEDLKFFTPPKLINAVKQAFPINVEEEEGGEESLAY